LRWKFRADEFDPGLSASSFCNSPVRLAHATENDLTMRDSYCGGVAEIKKHGSIFAPIS
jgi:hypothetical protein